MVNENVSFRPILWTDSKYWIINQRNQRKKKLKYGTLYEHTFYLVILFRVLVLYCDGRDDNKDRLNQYPELQNLSISASDLLKKIPVISSRLKNKMAFMKVIMRFFFIF